MKHMITCNRTDDRLPRLPPQNMFADCEEFKTWLCRQRQNTFLVQTKVAELSCSCYEDIKEFVLVASADDIAQFNSEYEGQIVIFSTDADFAQFVVSKKEAHQTFSITADAAMTGITPVIRPATAPAFFQSK